MRKLLNIALIIIILISITTISYASTNVELALSSTSQELYAEDTVVFTLKIDDMQEINHGINAMKAKLEYNKDIFEEVKKADFKPMNGWEGLQYNQDNNEFVIYKKVGTTLKEDVVEISLKVRKEVKANVTEVKVTNMVLSEGKEDIIIQKEDKTALNINIIEEQKPDDNKPDDNKPDDNKPDDNKPDDNKPDDNKPDDNKPDDNKPSDNKPSDNKPSDNKPSDNKPSDNKPSDNKPSDNKPSDNKPSDNKPSDNKPSDNKPSDSKPNKVEDNLVQGKLPQTGRNYIFLFLLLALEVVLSVNAVYFGGKFIKSEKQKMMMIIVIATILLMQFIGTVYGAVSYFSKKGDLNGDGEVSYADVDLLASHLVQIKLLEEGKSPEDAETVKQNADINNDGKLTVTDLSLIVQKIEKTLNYEVNISDAETNEYYTEKNKEITLKFNAIVSYGANIKKATINGKEVEVKKTEQKDDEYSFNATIGTISGVKTYNFTEVELDNGKKVKVDYTLKIDVLKEIPVIQNYEAEEDINEQKVKVSFDVIDKDSAITEATLEVLDDQEQIIQEERVTRGKNEIEIGVEYEKQYIVNIKLNYDLDTNELEKEEDHSGREILKKELQMIIDYNLKVTNIATKKDDKISNTFEKNEPIQLVFESTNATKYEVASVTVNGKGYDVSKNGKQYVCMSKRYY